MAERRRRMTRLYKPDGMPQAGIESIPFLWSLATRVFFRELSDELAHPHYPEVALGWEVTNRSFWR